MKNNTFIQAFVEYVNGVYKGSMNRIIAFMGALTICLIGLICVIFKRAIPDDFIVELIGVILPLLGLSAWSKNTDIKNDKPNPNLHEEKK